MNVTHSSPETTADPVVPDWRHAALCRDFDPEKWQPIGEAPKQTAEAVAICRRCPSLAPCRDFAMVALPHGIAGGLTEDERTAIRRGRRTGVARPAPTLLLDQLSPAARAAALEAGERDRIAEHVPPRIKSELVRSGGWDEAVPQGQADKRGGVRPNPRGRAELRKWLEVHGAAVPS